MPTDPYTALGVSRDATPDQLKKAYRKLAKDHHPDRNPGDPAAAQRFKDVSAAYEVLSDPERRAAYDTFGAPALKPGFDPARAHARRTAPGGASSATSIDELLGELFGRRAARAGGSRGPGFPGGGFPGGGFPAGGFGFSEAFDDGPGFVRADLAVDFRTAALGGERALTFTDGATLNVRIPPGVRDGETIKLAGKGPGGADLGLTLHVEDHPVFRRDGEDLHVTVPITVGEAVRGAKVPVPTLDGSVVRVDVPAGSQTGRTLRLRGKGIRRKGQTGDLYAELVVRVPERASAEVLDALDGSYAGDVRADLHGRAAA